MLVALSKLIYQICHLFSMCTSALPHLSWNYSGHDTNRKKKKTTQNIQVVLLEKKKKVLFSKIKQIIRTSSQASSLKQLRLKLELCSFCL